MKKWYQRLIIVLSWVLGGLIILGTFLDALSNAISLVTVPIAVVFTILMSSIWLIIQVTIRFSHIKWVTKDGQTITIKKLNLRHHLTIFGMIFLVWVPTLFPANTNGHNNNPEPSILRIEEVSQASRGPLWDNVGLSKDEVVANIRATEIDISSSLDQHSVICFWRLAQDFETNWHIGRRRDGSWYRIVKMELTQARGQTDWQLLVGGIECDKSYEGQIGLVLVAMQDEEIEKQARTWLGDDNGWGFRELPKGDSVLKSQIVTFTTTRVR